MIVAVPLAASLAAGLVLQRHPARDRLLRSLWTLSFNVLGPLTSLYAFAVLPLDWRTALLAALVVCTMWSALAVGYLYRLVAGRDARERATLALPIAFWNTGYVGYVIAQLLWGQHGFALMAFFDQAGYLMPAVVISTAIAHPRSERRRHDPALRCHAPRARQRAARRRGGRAGLKLAHVSLPD